MAAGYFQQKQMTFSRNEIAQHNFLFKPYIRATKLAVVGIQFFFLFTSLQYNGGFCMWWESKRVSAWKTCSTIMEIQAWTTSQMRATLMNGPKLEHLKQYQNWLTTKKRLFIRRYALWWLSGSKFEALALSLSLPVFHSIHTSCC